MAVCMLVLDPMTSCQRLHPALIGYDTGSPLGASFSLGNATQCEARSVVSLGANGAVSVRRYRDCRVTQGLF